MLAILLQNLLGEPPAPAETLPYPLVAAGLPKVVQLPAGGELAIAFVVEDAAGNPVAGVFGPGDVLQAVAWPGGGQPAVFQPSAAWTDAGAAEGRLQFRGAQTADVPPETYRLRVTVRRGGGDYLLHDGAVELMERPGSEPAMPTYVTHATCRGIAPWIDACFDPKTHLAGFLRERATARGIFDGLLVKNYRNGAFGEFEAHSAAALAWAGGGGRTSPLPSPLLKQWLADGKLLLTDQVVRINAYLTVAEIGRQMIGVNNVFAAQGQFFANLAKAEIANCTAEIDLNGDGVGDVPINLGCSNTLFG